MARIVIEGCAVATVDPAGTEYAEGHVVVEGDRIVAVGPGSAPPSDGTRIDGTGCLATPGLVNTHHHLYQWATRGRAQQADLFGWLHELYPVWARIDAETVAASATAGLGWLALSGCPPSADHHYGFPPGAGDLLGAPIPAAPKAGLRFRPPPGSLGPGLPGGGLPPAARGGAGPVPAGHTARAPTGGSGPASGGCAACSTPGRRSGSASTVPRPRRPASSAANCARRCCSPGSGAVPPR